jgi:translation initiation factor 2B subunit (eIF-2B alpha/beta/delta family)
MPEVDGAWNDLRRTAEDTESGAAEIARRAAATLAALPPSDLVEAVRTLVRGHPPMAPLWRLGHAVLSADDHVAAAAAFAARLAGERAAVAAASAPVLGAEVVTHSYSSTLVAAVAAAGATASCARSEPGGEGRLTAERLTALGVAAHEVDDRDALRAAAEGTTVVTGADAVGPGGVVNKVGTRALAEAARGGGGRCIAVAGGSKLVAADLPAWPPFERVPFGLFTLLLTQDGALTPSDAPRVAARFEVHPALADLLG